MMSLKFVICIALAVLAAQCNAEGEQWNAAKTKSLLDRFKDWINNKLEQFKQKVINAVEKIKNFKESLTKKSLTYIHQPVVSVEKDLATWTPMFPEKCITTAKTQLNEVKTASAKEFMLCANVTNAFVDAAKIVSKSADVLVQLSKLFTDIFQAVYKCRPLFTSKGFQCARKYIITIVNDVKEGVPVLTSYFEEMQKLVFDLKAQITTCLHPPKAKLEKDLNNLITSLHSCVA